MPYLRANYLGISVSHRSISILHHFTTDKTVVHQIFLPVHLWVGFAQPRNEKRLLYLRALQELEIILTKAIKDFLN